MKHVCYLAFPNRYLFCCLAGFFVWLDVCGCVGVCGYTMLLHITAVIVCDGQTSVKISYYSVVIITLFRLPTCTQHGGDGVRIQEGVE